MGDPLARLKERGDCPVRTAMGDHGRSPGITPPGHREAQEVTLPIPGAECAPLTNLLTPEHSSPDARGRHAVALEPYGYRWFRVGPLLDVIMREAR
jgi:hypothetical protein